MSATPFDALLKTFRRQVTAIRIMRMVILIAFAVTVVGAGALPDPAGRNTIFLFSAAAIIGWFAWLVSAVRLTREVQASSIFLATGQIDRAEFWLRQVIERFSLC